ncbi:MAG TPA: glycosyltransferase family 39 protein [Acidobacteriota bacterium]|nr:glycosyltransferase family 39 protein [Acidobacteriota bacterium]
MIIDRKSLGWVLAITIAPLLLFIQKPFHIDDSAFLEVAENILQHPLDPFHGTVALVDQDYRVFHMKGVEPNTFESMSHPPLVPYVMAAVIKAWRGISEVPLHTVFMIFPILAAISSFSIAERFTKNARAAALFLVASPIFMVNAQNLMTDVPMFALVQCSIAFFVYGTDQKKISLLILAGLFAGLGMLTRYVAFLTIPVFFAYAYLHEQKSKPALISTFCAFVIFSIWLIENIVLYGYAHITASYSFYKSFYSENHYSNLIKAVCDVAALGGLSIPFAFVCGFNQRKNLKLTLLCALIASAILLLTLRAGSSYLIGYSRVKLWLLFLFSSAGCYLLIAAIQSFIRSVQWKQGLAVVSQDQMFLFIWFAVTFCAAIFVLPFGTARYVLPALFPLILILIGSLNEVSIKNKFTTICILCTFAGSILISFADLEFALTYKTFAKNIREMYGTERIWFIGEWGFRYYMKKEGAKYLLSNDRSPSTGDIVIKPEIAGLHEMHATLAQRCRMFEPFIVETSDPIRVLNPIAKAGFYAHGYGLLPISISNVPLEEFEICRVAGKANDH